MMNYLLNLAEKFIGWKSIEGNDQLIQIHTLKVLAENNLKKHYSHKYNKTIRLINDADNINLTPHINNFFLSEIAAKEFSSQQKRKHNHHLQDVTTHLDNFYFLNKLKYTCIMINWHFFHSAKFETPFIHEIKNFLLKEKNVHPSVKIYLQILQILTNKNPDPFFKNLINLLNTNQQQLSKNERKEVYLYAINFCARKIRNGEDEYLNEALKLYGSGIKDESLFENGFLSPWTYTNVVKAALRLKRYKWIENFIFENKEKIDPPYRENAFEYNLAELYYYTKEYDKAMTHLNKVKTFDIFHLVTRVILIKIFYEKDAQESLLSLIASFLIFLKRNKDLSNNVKKPYLNFCELIHQILRSKPDKKEIIKSKIENEPILNDRAWLLEVLEKEMN